MALKTIEARIDKKGRIYLPSKIRKINFFSQKTFRLLPIVRTSTKQIEKGLLLVSPSDEFDATYFWGNYDMKERYTIDYDPRGRLTTTENIMKDLGLHPFAYKYVFLVESCFGWELWPEHRFKRILRTLRAYKIKVTDRDNIKNIPTGLWVDAWLTEKSLFSKEAGRNTFLNAVKKSIKSKTEKTFLLLETVNNARLLSGGTLKDIKREINYFVGSSGYHFALPFLDTESRLMPSGFIKISHWKAKDIMQIVTQRIRDLSASEISERVASHYVMFSQENAKKFIDRVQLLKRPFNIDNSELYSMFWPINAGEGYKKNLEDKSFKTYQLMSRRADVYFNEHSRANIEMEFYKRC